MRESYSSHAKIPFNKGVKMVNKTGTKEFDLVGYIMDYEGGEISDKRILELMSHLIKTGQAWTLQGHYGRTAKQLIDSGYINEDGKISIDVYFTIEGELK
ncbi:MAG: hypothetical protein QQN41_10470 [Nitrosopumilus sp.]